MISLIIYLCMHLQVNPCSGQVPFQDLVQVLEHLDPAYVGASPLAAYVWLHSNQLRNLNQYQLEPMSDMSDMKEGRSISSSVSLKLPSDNLKLVRLLFPDKDKPLEPEGDPDKYVTHLSPQSIARIVRFFSFQILPSFTVDKIKRRILCILQNKSQLEDLSSKKSQEIEEIAELLANAVIEARKPGFSLGYRFPSQLLMAYLLAKTDTVKDIEVFLSAIPELMGRAHHPWQDALFIQPGQKGDFLDQSLNWLEALENGLRHPLVGMKALAAIPTFGVEQARVTAGLCSTSSAHEEQAYQAARQILQWMMGVDSFQRLQVLQLWNISEARGGRSVVAGLWKFFETFPTPKAQSEKEVNQIWRGLFEREEETDFTQLLSDQRGKPDLQVYSILETALIGRFSSYVTERQECEAFSSSKPRDLSPFFEELLSAPEVSLKVRRMKHGYLFEKGQGVTSEVACLLFSEDCLPRFSISETPDNLSSGGLRKLLGLLESVKPDLATNEAFTDSLMGLFSFFKDPRVLPLLIDALQFEERSKEWVARSLLALDLTECTTRQMAARVIFEQELELLYPMAIHLMEGLADESFMQPYLLLLALIRLDPENYSAMLLRAFNCSKGLDPEQLKVVLEDLGERGLESRVFWLLGQEEKHSFGNVMGWSPLDQGPNPKKKRGSFLSFAVAPRRPTQTCSPQMAPKRFSPIRNQPFCRRTGLQAGVRASCSTIGTCFKR